MDITPNTPNTFKEVNQTEQAPKDALVFLKTKDVAAILGCSVPVARELMHRKDFPLIGFGRNLRVSKAALEKWAMERHV